MSQSSSSKRKYTYVWVSAIILIFGIFVVREIGNRFGPNGIVDTKSIIASNSAAPLSFILTNGEKRKVPAFRFQDQDGKWITQNDMLGKVYVVDFFFTTCPTICPLMTENLRSIKNDFAKVDDLGILSFTINPRYDTQEVLKKYAGKQGKAQKGWHFLRSDAETTYKLAQEGFYIHADEEADAPGGFEHSGMFALVDRQGYLRCRIDAHGNPLVYYRGNILEKQGVNSEGEEQQITILKEDIKKLLEE